MATPATVLAPAAPGGGMSAERLAAIKAWMQGEVDAKRVPGAVRMIARHGKVVFSETVGRLGPQADAPPMRADSLFRIYSMTKPIASVAAMMLVEDGRLLPRRRSRATFPSRQARGRARSAARRQDGRRARAREPADLRAGSAAPHLE
ncbi:MAG: serine hydrolase domain-containing protein [Candidatus Eisenbacteria bacterium]